MATLLYSATMSLDGFIAGPGGDMSWLTPYLGPNSVVDELIPRVGAILVGGRTFRGDDPHAGSEAEGEVFGGGWEGPQFVLTRTPPDEPVPGVTFVTDVGKAVAAARSAAGDRYVNVLGAETARSCLEAGELDQVLVFIAPVLLGAGVRLFEYPGGTHVGLERIDFGTAPFATHIWFRVARRVPRGRGTVFDVDTTRDRDPAGRPRNARPRDAAGRPLPRGAEGVERVPEDLVLSADESVTEAQRLLDDGLPFPAHDVLEAAWKAAPAAERELWRGLAQLAVGLTHAQRGNARGAAALLERAAHRIGSWAAPAPADLDIAGLQAHAEALARRIERDGLDGLTDADLRPRLRVQRH